jgi:hypothetical protein
MKKLTKPKPKELTAPNAANGSFLAGGREKKLLLKPAVEPKPKPA